MSDFEKLYRAYAQDVFRFAIHLCGDSAEAEDIVAETFARALTASDRLKAQTVKSYLLTIARHYFYEKQKRASKHIGVKSQDEAASIETSGTTEELYSVQDEAKAVHTFLANCKERERTALLLRADGLSYQEIADILGISVSLTKVSVHRLRARLIEWRIKRDKQ